MGYTYVGENSLYRLTAQEVRRLVRGYVLRQNRVVEQVEAARPKVGRDSDWEKLRRFAQKHGAIAG